MNPHDEEDDQPPQPSPIQFPCLLWEPSLDVVVLATEMGTGTVLRAGRSRVLRLGMVIPYASSRWCIGGEDWDFIVPPPELKIALRNILGQASRPIRVDIQLENPEED